MYQNSAATPPDPQACIPGRQDSFQNFGLQAISETGPLNPVQIYAATLNPNTDNTPQYTILSTCKTCPYGNSSFALQNGVVTPYGLFGNPRPLLPTVGESQVFYGFLSVVPYAGYCAKPNPVSPSGPFIGFPVLSVNGHADLWGLCTNTSAGGRVDVVYSPVANHPHYNKDDCQGVYLQMSQPYAFVP